MDQSRWWVFWFFTAIFNFKMEELWRIPVGCGFGQSISSERREMWRLINVEFANAPPIISNTHKGWVFFILSRFQLFLSIWGLQNQEFKTEESATYVGPWASLIRPTVSQAVLTLLRPCGLSCLKLGPQEANEHLDNQPVMVCLFIDLFTKNIPCCKLT